MKRIIQKHNIISHKDNRGELQKVYDSKSLTQLIDIKEVFITTSIKNTLRGMHYQLAPFELNKIVVCLQGNILDVIVNIDKNDKDFGKHSFVELKKNESILVPQNFAHGFYCYEDSKVLYLTDNNYSKENESGILWDSINFKWPISDPILSLRDESFMKLSEI
jgi:dTDP-4-dehydrorhamnose 3,5-epimerase